MSNRFDGYSKRVFDTVGVEMGYDASWNDGTAVHSARVLFREPTTQEKISIMVEEDLITPMMEYKIGDFPGLFESVRRGDSNYVTINGASYFVRTCRQIFDGRTFQSKLEIQN